MRSTWRIVGLVAFLSATAHAHNIPNARVDRSIQVTVRPERLEVDYEVSLSELTVARDLRDLVGTLVETEPKALYERYGQETGPLNAKGILASVDGRPLDLLFQGLDIVVEEHPRYTFHFDAKLPTQGRLVVQDTNYVTSEGTSRLAVRGLEGVAIRGDDLPPEVGQIAIRPVWQLTDLEERRTKLVEVDFVRPRTSVPTTIEADAPPHMSKPASPVKTPPDRLSKLLDRASRGSLLGLLLVAFGLGMAHAIQPGHGKSLVAAAVVGRRGRWYRGTLLALVATST
ncbi:nickel/cobalt transporter, partial [Singulisphaera rosea]